MVEVVASYVTLVATSLALINGTAALVQDIRGVDAVFEDLCCRLSKWEKCMNRIEMTYHEVGHRRGNPARWIMSDLEHCQAELKYLRSLLAPLESLEPRTLRQRVKITYKMRSGDLKPTITKTIAEIEDRIRSLNDGINQWTLCLTASADRRLEAYITHQSYATAVPLDTPAPSPLTPTASSTPARLSADAETMIPLTRDYLTTETLIEDSVPSAKQIDESNMSNFRYIINVRSNQEVDVQAIRDAFNRYQNKAALSNCRDDAQRTPLHHAAQRGNIEVARILLEYSADIDAKDSRKRSVLDLALEHNRDSFVEFLIQGNVDTSAIMTKRSQERFDEIAYLLARRSSKDDQNRRGSKSRSPAINVSRPQRSSTQRRAATALA